MYNFYRILYRKRGSEDINMNNNNNKCSTNSMITTTEDINYLNIICCISNKYVISLTQAQVYVLIIYIVILYLHK